MTKEQFDLWKNRNDVIKIDTDVFVNVCSNDRTTIASVIWSHRGLPHRPSEEVRRFNVTFIEKGNSDIYEQMVNSAFNVDVFRYLMVNYHEPNYAIIYSMNLDITKRNFSLTMEEPPLLGTGIISNEESAGLSLKF